MAANLTDALQALLTASQGEQQLIKSNNAAAAADVERAAALKQIIIDADATIAKVVTQGQIDTQNRKAGIYSIAGGAGRQTTNMVDVMAANDRVKAQISELRRKEDRTIGELFTDPGGYLYDVFTTETSRDAVKGAVTQAQAIQSGATAEYQRMTQDFQVADELTQKVDDTVLLAAGEKAAAARDAALIEMRDKQRALGLDDAKAIVQLKTTEVELATRAENSARAAEQVRMARAQFAAMQEERQMRRAEAAAREAAIKEGKAEEDYYVEMIKKGAGLEGTNLEGANLPSLKMFVRRSTVAGSDEHRWLLNGIKNTAIGPGSRIIASTPADGLDFTKSRGGQLPPQLQRAGEELRELERRFMSDPKIVKGLDGDQKKAKAAFNTWATEQMRGTFGEVTPGSVADIAPAATAMVKAQTPLANLPVVKNFLKPHLDTGGSLVMNKDFIAKAAEAVRNKQITAQDFISGMSAIYSRAALLNTSQLRLGDLGLDVPNAGRSYNVNLYSGDGPQDFTKAANLQRALAWGLARPELTGTGRRFLD